MNGEGAPCPNCGEGMTRYRIEHTPASHYDAELEWSICSACQHVRLERWALRKPEKFVGMQDVTRAGYE